MMHTKQGETYDLVMVIFGNYGRISMRHIHEHIKKLMRHFFSE